MATPSGFLELGRVMTSLKRELAIRPQGLRSRDLLLVKRVSYKSDNSTLRFYKNIDVATRRDCPYGCSNSEQPQRYVASAASAWDNHFLCEEPHEERID